MDHDVLFHGKVSDDEMREYIKNCDVLVLPSIARSEAFGLVQIEAMAFGKPVINTCLDSGVPYVSLDHVTGITVEPNNVMALAEAMNWMVEHENERIGMGESARERMKAEFKLDVMLERIMKVYDK